MAIIYGRAEAEKDLLRISPNSVKKVEDLEIIHHELKDKLSNNKKNFFNNLPIKIKKEEEELEKIKNDEKITLQKYDEKIKNLEEKKAKGRFSMISASVKISILKNYSKRRDMNEIKDLRKKAGIFLGTDALLKLNEEVKDDMVQLQKLSFMMWVMFLTAILLLRHLMLTKQ
ncbi:MAG: hypothetical protein IH843_02640 [Thaumarchaeota archaeon]|nr:hypothetical protein [Nitrososphaerota archaeon]